jgi:hypothetical protein
LKRRFRRPIFLAVAFFATAVAVASAVSVQAGGVRVTALAQVVPYKLPRLRPAPISVLVTGHVASVTGGIPPQLVRMDIEVNRHGLLQSEGLPACQVRAIKTASTQKALQLCSPALIGSGRFWAHIVLPDQQPYPTHGRLLIFNGRSGKKHMVLAHIFTSNPFPSSFVVAFAMRKLNGSQYGTKLSAAFPQALGDWGYVDRIKLNLKRKYHYHGKRLSYFNASCPAPGGTDSTAYPLALSTFYFDGRKPVRVTVSKACGVRD